jgi:AcrR family transcriptional regulator
MKAKSDVLAERHRRGRTTRQRAQGTKRLPHAVRRQQILAKATEFFAEYGLTAQTRALAEVCGVSQRLLYRFFPNKAALIAELYKAEIAGPFKAVWFAQLADRSKPVEQRLNEFYREYYDQVLTRRWLRLFLYASLAEVAMAPTYIATLLTHMLEVIVGEAALELGLRPPRKPALRHELAWALHGAVSHLAIRRRVYGNTNPTSVNEVIAMHVRLFLAGLASLLPSETKKTDVVT